MEVNSGVWVLEDSSDDEAEAQNQKPIEIRSDPVCEGSILMEGGQTTPIPVDGVPGQQSADNQMVTDQSPSSIPDTSFNVEGAATEDKVEEAKREAETLDLIPPTQIKKKLLHYFKNAARSFKIAYHDDLKNAPNPGLHLIGHGMIGFPLAEADISRIKEASCGSKGDDSIVVEANGIVSTNVWEIDPSRDGRQRIQNGYHTSNQSCLG